MYVLPYLEQNAMLQTYKNLGGNDLTMAGGNWRYNSSTNGSQVTNRRLKILTCPSDNPNAPLPPTTSHNYVVNYGNTSFFQTTLNGVPFREAPFHCYRPEWISPAASAMQDEYSQNHPDHDRYGHYPQFGKAGQPQVPIQQIADGTSTTLMASEVIQGVGASPGTYDLRGFTWWGGSSGFTTWSPPNANEPDVMMGADSCNPGPTGAPCTLISTDARPRMMAARSRHTGGVNAARCDGSVGFVKDSININVWRALSTAQGGEVVNELDL
jgi:prepilin-type processing-associated H-X9-DG protein